MKKLLIGVVCIFIFSCHTTYPDYDHIYYYYYRGAWVPYHYYEPHRVYHPVFHQQRPGGHRR
jgi:hypothetical protein